MAWGRSNSSDPGDSEATDPQETAPTVEDTPEVEPLEGSGPMPRFNIKGPYVRPDDPEGRP